MHTTMHTTTNTTTTNTTSFATDLPQLRGVPFLTEAGLETDLVFNHGVDLPYFATFPLLEDAAKRALFTEYYQRVVDLARGAGTGVLLETLTWRASSDWGEQLGYDAAGLDRANRDAVRLFADLRDANPDVEFVISGNLGPRGDGYVVGETMTAEEAERYHVAQVRSLAAGGADSVSALTLTYAAEAIGIVRAARAVGIPVVISFTLETDGNLPCGQSLADAIAEVDAATDRYAAYFMVNCAHPTHFAHILDAPGPWDRLRGLRANASKMSHAELDVAEELDRGDEHELADGYAGVLAKLPHVAVVGGCCGTDLAHLGVIVDTVVAPRTGASPETV